MELSATTLAILCGFLGGFALGVAARWGRFCTLGAIEDSLYGGDNRRLRSWAVAIGTAILLVHLLWWNGLIDLRDSFYITSPLSLIGIAVGGTLFGIGMALTGTCAYGVLARVGGGDLKAMVVFMVIGVCAYATLSGVFAPVRIWLESFALPLNDIGGQHIGLLLSELTGHNLIPASVLLVVGCLYYWGFKDAAFRTSPRHLISGLAVGTVIALGWTVTSVLHDYSFDPVAFQSYTFVAPSGRTLVYFMTYMSSAADFGIGTVIGVIVGALVTTLIQHRFHWEACDDVRELRRHMIGGAFMGIGGILALGCSVGQALSAASCFALSAPIAIAAMVFGARLGLVYLVEGRIGLPFLGSRTG